MPQKCSDDWEQIRQATLRRDEVEPRARDVRFDADRECLELILTNGICCLIPTRLLQGVAGGDAGLVAQVELDRRGYALHWEALDADLTVPDLLAGCFGSHQWMEKLRTDGLLNTYEKNCKHPNGWRANSVRTERTLAT